MSPLTYPEADLMRSHEGTTPHLINGQRLHGGFDAQGRYIPPRTLVRGPALEAWTEALRARGGDILSDTASLLDGLRYPTARQMKFLIQQGLGQSFWNMLTIIGKIEGKGRLLADFPIPNFQNVIVDDISEMAIGHLHKGLLKAHGIDEGGEPAKGIGGHDVMWFAARDLAFGPNAYPDVEPPERIMRPGDEAGPPKPLIDPAYHGFLNVLLNLLMIEFRAELGFQFTQDLLRDPELFQDRRAEALEAAEIIGRIRTDEEVHVTSLKLYFGEFRQVTFKTPTGGTISGRELVDPTWQEIIHWATREQPKLAMEQERKILHERIRKHPDGARIVLELEALADTH
jgi:hypothetical protein